MEPIGIDDLKRLPDTFYRVSIKALIFDEQQRLLVFQDDEGKYEIPGGGWEHNEALETCIRRELMEEMRVTARHISPVQFVYTNLHQNGYYKLCVVVKAELESSEFVPSDDNLVRAKFCTYAEFMALPFQQEENGIVEHADKIWTD